MADVSFGIGILCTLLAAVFFGIQYVPCKQYSTYDGAVFQWFMCSGIIWGGIILQLILMFAFDWPGPQIILYGVLSGFLWGSANFLVIPLVRICGLALGFSLYHIINLTWGYCLSRFGLFGMDQDIGRIPILRDVGVFVLLASFVMLFWVEPEEGKTDPNKDLKTKDRPSESVRAKNLPSAQSQDTPAAGDEDVEVVKNSTGVSDKKYVFGLNRLQAIKIAGIVLAIAAGVLTAMNGWPYALWTQTTQGKEMMAVQFVFSQTIGIYTASSIWYWISSTVRQFGFKKRTHHSVIRPAFIAGLFWVAGDVNMLYGIDGIGYAAAYTLDAVGPVMVASVLSLLWFKEIKETKQRIWFIASFLAQVAGCIMCESHLTLRMMDNDDVNRLTITEIISLLRIPNCDNEDAVEKRLSVALQNLLGSLRRVGTAEINQLVREEALLSNCVELLVRVMKRFPNLADSVGECLSAATSENVICGSGAPVEISFGNADVFYIETASYYGAGIGCKVWPAAVALAQKIYNKTILFDRNPEVVEIGSGVGLVGIAAAKFGEASSVCFTDMMESLLEVAMKNAKRNCPEGCFDAKVLDWRKPNELLKTNAEVLIGADVIYEKEHADLIIGLLQHFAGNRTILALMPQRPGYDKFMAELQRCENWTVRQSLSVITVIGECQILDIHFRK
ncbi:hypothetical protein FOL47_008532 [Perkinsus chesapeaki]|uniref:Uncharacterized protein n=1 Tax=Perkinsus chesapeaki TaxID=330153 RepID=A0A7J6LE79_PERCH|nr:hypothetical protein FOL47_008532 [Perkinsus chesapeaki]